MTPIRNLAAVATLAVLGACAQVDAPQMAGSSDDVAAARVTGEAVSCIGIPTIRSTRVQDRRTIDFETTGGKVYRNTLPSSCPALNRFDGFTYETSLSRLCNVDIVYPLQRFDSTLQRGAGCALGEFTPVEYVETGAKEG